MGQWGNEAMQRQWGNAGNEMRRNVGQSNDH